MSRDQSAAQWQEIQRLYGRDMVASTAHLAQRYVADNPKCAIAWLYLGASLGQIARYSEALGALRRAARLFPPGKRCLVYFHFAQLYERKGMLRFAERWYLRAIADCPSDASYRIKLGIVLHNTGRLHEGVAVLRRATRCKEGCREEAYLNMGLALRGLKRLREARRCFRQALDIDPKYAEARGAIADIEYVMERNGNA